MTSRQLTVGAALLCGALGLARESEPRAWRPLLAEAPAEAQAAVNPYEGNADAVRAGRKLYAQHCAECHGADARGTPRAPALVNSSLELTRAGRVFWVLTNGDRRGGMPSWSRLPVARRWQIVSFLKTVNPAPTPDRP
jgi:mono/diheme cytochrome c family protein